MTLIVAIGCDDGVVLASESCSTDFANRTKVPVDKVYQIPGQPILFAGSGDSGLIDRVRESFNGFTVRGSLKADRKELKGRVVPELQEALQSYIAVPGSQPTTACFLIAGVRDRKAWILEIATNGGDTFYGDQYGSFAAIGSGGTFAHATFRPHLRQNRNLKEGVLHAFRIIDDAIEIAAFGLGRPIQIHSIAADGTVRKTDPDELKAISDLCEGWRALERETFARAVAPPTSKEETPEIPKP